MKPHAIPWIALQQVFQRLLEVLEELSKLLVQEEAVMKGLDREKMMALVEQKANVLENFHRSEQHLVALLRPWVPTGSSAECWSLLKQQPDFLRVHQLPVFKAIRRETARVREQGQKNAVLVRRGQYVVREAMNLINTGLGQGPVYQGTGTLRVQPVPCSVNLRG